MTQRLVTNITAKNHTTERRLDGRLPGPDHLRALAIALVFLCHYGGMFAHPDWMSPIAKVGWAGVDLFFVLSGYLIAGPLFQSLRTQQHFALRPFYIKRLLRILPTYYVVLALYFLFPGTHEREALAPLWKYGLFVQNIGLDLSRQGTFSHAWSLCIEEQFYLFLPLVLLATARTRPGKWRWLLPPAVLLLTLAVRGFCWQHYVAADSDNPVLSWYQWIYYPTWSRLDGLTVGVIIAALQQYLPQLFSRLTRKPLLPLLAGLLLLGGATLFGGDPQGLSATLFCFLLVALGFGCILLSALSGKGGWQKRSRVTGWLASVSYALYLVHKMSIHGVQVFCERLGLEVHGNGVFALSLLGSLLAAALLRWLVERPALALRDRLLRRGWDRAIFTPVNPIPENVQTITRED